MPRNDSNRTITAKLNSIHLRQTRRDKYSLTKAPTKLSSPRLMVTK
jgi:hypothetical protein